MFSIKTRTSWRCALAGIAAAATLAPGAAQARAREQLAYDQKTGISVVDADGRHQKRLIPWHTRRCGGDCMDIAVPRHPRWSPDGRRLAYQVESFRIRGGVASPTRATRIMVARASGRGRRFLTRGHLPAWSPDGKRIHYIADSVHELDDGMIRSIELHGGARGQLPVKGTTEFSPDGASVLGRAGLVPLDGLPPTPLELWRPYNRTAISGPARFNPDGSITYPCNPPGPARSGHTRTFYGELCVGDPVTHRYRRLARTRDFHETEGVLSPSRRFWAVAGMHGLYVKPANGGRRRMVVRNPGELPPTSNIPHSPDWRPR